MQKKKYRNVQENNLILNQNLNQNKEINLISHSI